MIINEFKKIAKGAIDLYRTAPYGGSLLIADLGLVPLVLNEPVLLGGVVVAGCGATELISRQIRLRDELENFVSRHGYVDKAFESTIGEWCARQTARVVAERHDCLEEYESLCARYKEKVRCAFLPHI